MQKKAEYVSYRRNGGRVLKGPAWLEDDNWDFPGVGPYSLGYHWLATAIGWQVQFPHPPCHRLMLIMPLPVFLEGSFAYPWGEAVLGGPFYR